MKASWIAKVKVPDRSEFWVGNFEANGRTDAKRAARLFVSGILPLEAAVKSALVVREAFETLRTGEDSTGSGDPWDILAHAVDVGTIRAIEIAGNDPDKNPMLPIMLKANAALKRIRERHDRLGKWALDGSAVVELRAAMDVYQEILMASSPAQMSKAAEVRMSVIAGKPSKIIEMPTP